MRFDFMETWDFPPPQEGAPDLGKTFAERSARCRAPLLRALLAAEPLRSARQSVLEGDTYYFREYTNRWSGHEPKTNVLAHARRHDSVVLEIPTQAIRDLPINNAISCTDGSSPLLDLLSYTCELDPSTFTLGDGDRLGKVIILTKEAYQRLAVDVLKGAADPEIGMKIYGSTNAETYRYSLTERESEPARALANMYRQAGLNQHDTENLIALASSKDNFEYIAFLRQQPRQYTGRAAQHMSVDEISSKGSTVPQWRR
jgi:hypothetical protein